MKQIIFIIFLSLIFCLNIKAQASEEIIQLKTPRKPTKAELKRWEKLSKDTTNYCPLADYLIEIKIEIEPKILSNGEKVSVVKATFNTNDLFFKQTEKGELISSIKISGSITPNDRSKMASFDNEVNFVISKEQIGKLDTLFYQKIFELPEGKYRLFIFARDTQRDGIGGKNITFEVNKSFQNHF